MRCRRAPSATARGASSAPGHNDAVVQPFINAQENVDRTVGRRNRPADGLSITTSRKAESEAWRRSFGGIRVPRGVHRFRSHREADEWLWQMITRPTT